MAQSQVLAQALLISKRGDGIARLAQSVERKALDLVVVGSSPTVGVLPSVGFAVAAFCVLSGCFYFGFGFVCI